jgi:exodeoxyribonuclease V alpha subunit
VRIQLFQDDIDRYLRDGTVNRDAIVAHATGLTSSVAETCLDQAARGRDPYQVWSQENGITFAQARALRRRLDVTLRRPGLETITLAVLGMAEDNGQSFVDLRDLCCKISAYGACHIREAARSVGLLIASGDLTTFDWLGVKRIALTRHFRQERRLQNLITNRLQPGSPCDDAVITNAACAAKIVLHPEQHAAVKLALQHRMIAIQGGPGTGKTTILKTIVEALRNLNETNTPLCVALPARIARMIHERIGIGAETIHRALDYSDAGFGRNAANPIDADLIVVEEAFMVGNELLESLLGAIRPTARIIFVGDPEQIEPIGLGKPLEALMSLGRIPVAHLTHNHRSGEGSTIPNSGRRIMKGQRPIFGADIALRSTLTSAQSVQEAVVLYRALEALHGEGNVQILSPRHKGALGTRAINDAVTARSGFAIGDRIMQMRNDASQDFFNGETGKVVEMASNRITIVTDGGSTAHYDTRRMEHLAKAHCITYHKAQGLEYEAVIMILDPEARSMINRNMINVGVTRARQKCVIINRKDALERGLSVRANDNRRTTIGCIA